MGEWEGIRAGVPAVRSVDVGCVGITKRHLRVDPSWDRDVGSAEMFAHQTRAGAFTEVLVQTARTWVGVAGPLPRSAPSPWPGLGTRGRAARPDRLFSYEVGVRHRL